MDGPLEERPDSEGESHEDVGCFEPEHILQEVLGQLAVLPIVEPVGAESGERDQKEHEDHECLEHFGFQVEAEGSEGVSEAEEAEELDIVLNEEFEENPPEGVGPQEDADPKVKEQVEAPIAEEHKGQDGGHKQHEVVHGAGYKQVGFSLLFEVGWVRVGMVLGELLDRCFEILLDLF